MRILLACHEPPQAGSALLDAGDLARLLARAGHVVRLWDASNVVFDDGPAPQMTGAAGVTTFESVSSSAIAGYLDAARRQLDELVRWFDPDVIHTDYLWLLAYLALESGVPYVASVRGPELAVYRADARYDTWVRQAAENAGRLLFAPRAVSLEELEATLPELETPTVVLPGGGQLIEALSAHYALVREERCGLFAAR